MIAEPVIETSLPRRRLSFLPSPSAASAASPTCHREPIRYDLGDEGVLYHCTIPKAGDGQRPVVTRSGSWLQSTPARYPQGPVSMGVVK